MEILNDIMHQIGHLSAGALVIICVVVAGYVVKAIPKFPCGWIPIVTLAVAITMAILVGEQAEVDYHCSRPQVRLGMVGVVYWGIGWLLHNQGLSRLEKFLPAPLRTLLGVDEKPPEQKTP